MAATANNFATMLHRSTNKTTLVLVYAFLEWILIILLLLNSLFSYLIIKFADYFGLKRPCIWCSRIDHIIDPKNSKNYYCRDLVCESHASEISQLGYCYNHRKLAESENMCEDCSSSTTSFPSSSSQPDYVKFCESFGFLPWMKQKIATRCSCCGVHLDLIVKPSVMQNLITQDEGDDHSDRRSRSDSAFDHQEDHNTEESNKKTTHNDDDQPKKMPPQHLEFFIYGDNCSLIPVEFADSAATENRYKVEEDEDVILDFDMHGGDGEEAEHTLENWHVSGDTGTMLQDEEDLKQSHQDLNIGPTFEHPHRNLNVEGQMERREGGIGRHIVFQALEDETQMQGDDQFEAEVSIGTEIPDQEHVDEYQIQDILLEDSNQQIQEDPSSGSVGFHALNQSGGDKDEEKFVEFKTMSIETSIPKVENDQLESSLEFNEKEEEKIPDTPTSIDSLHHLHKKLLLLERKEHSATEESLDGSVISDDIESSEITIEELKSALKAERKAISSLYAELEEERNSSAVAANQTMAMINRLQEEKAKMQMEALQYQRMMEEQSEYDQEALQLVNELMVKREKEKQELEKELETYRNKVQEFEVKDSSMDLNHEVKEETNGFCSQHNNTTTPVDAVLYSEESLANFEEERLSILEQLKVLEEKLVMLNHEEEEEDVCYENGHVNGFTTNGHSYTKEIINGGRRKIMGPKGKRLLPLFDAIGAEENGMDLDSFEKFSWENTDQLEEEKKKKKKKKKRVGLEEEDDNVFERLEAVEADREFLKQCIRCLRKGDKGLHLLQEILQHLRNVEQRVRNNFMDDFAV